MKKIVTGVMAHVDAGKTTLSEALLYLSGATRKLGRVDHGSAFLDTQEIERQRGITVFSKQAELTFLDTDMTLLDTPGHTDFAAEAERVLQVIDCAILVISATDGVQAHTRTLWELLERNGVPVFIFVNKTDLCHRANYEVLSDLKKELDGRLVDLTDENSLWQESAAMCSEGLLDTFLDTGTIDDKTLSDAIHARQVFPCVFGSALKLDGVERFMQIIDRCARAPIYSGSFGAKVFKISRDDKGARLTYMKITGGRLRVKDLVTNRKATVPASDVWQEKCDQIRIYSGEKYVTADEVKAGQVCAVTGLTRTRPGEGLGAQSDSDAAQLEPVMEYLMVLPPRTSMSEIYQMLSQLAEEDPQLHLSMVDDRISVRLMGEVQLEILKSIIKRRFGLDADFSTGSVIYKETVASAVEGVGHYEPLRHYAEVHLLIEPGKPGSGVQTASLCSEDLLDRNWQRLIFTHLHERTFAGVLTGSELTDVKISILSGRAHDKHTEGGDFRQATYRAVRHGLMRTKSVLLEPYYAFRIEASPDAAARAISDVQKMGGSCDTPVTAGDKTMLTGKAPVARMQDYNREFISYTRGLGRLFLTFGGYFPCARQDEVVSAIGYDAKADTLNPADSVFCSHGAGHVVPWDEVEQHMHLPYSLKRPAPEPEMKPRGPVIRKGSAAPGSLEEDKQLMEIFERTYGKIKQRDIFTPDVRRVESTEHMLSLTDPQDSYLLVDGYNIIFAWDELRTLARDSLDTARSALINILANYRGFRQINLILVFDAYKVTGGEEKIEQINGLYVVYTREAELADTYIERVTGKISKKCIVRVATSDGLEQLIAFSHGARRVSADAFRQEIGMAAEELRALIRKINEK